MAIYFCKKNGSIAVGTLNEEVSMDGNIGSLDLAAMINVLNISFLGFLYLSCHWLFSVKLLSDPCSLLAFPHSPFIRQPVSYRFCYHHAPASLVSVVPKILFAHSGRHVLGLTILYHLTLLVIFFLKTLMINFSHIIFF